MPLSWQVSVFHMTPDQDPPWFLKRPFIPLHALHHQIVVMQVSEERIVPSRIRSASSEVMHSGWQVGGGEETRILLRWRRNPASSIFGPIEECNAPFGAVTFKCGVKPKQIEPERHVGREDIPVAHSFPLRTTWNSQQPMKYGLRLYNTKSICSSSEWSPGLEWELDGWSPLKRLGNTWKKWLNKVLSQPSTTSLYLLKSQLWVHQQITQTGYAVFLNPP